MLSAGTKLGAHEIVAPLGAGGMGEVYRARDTKLNRDVALKILPDAFVLDPDRLARFTREAQTLAALNHPNIAAIYGIEESTDVRALVMELVEGDTLEEKIRHGSGLMADGYGRSQRSPIGDQPSAVSHQPSQGLPLDEALPIAKQIAEALEAAHDQGIIHRDLKPANIKVRGDGVVKVLDFGLAKAMEPLASSSAAAALANSPTITNAAAMTSAGVILGTAAYMSPEQARGKVVDKRTDIWAFGCVLYEMLTGARPFSGDDVTDTIAAVVRADPDWSKLPSDTPAAIRRLLRRCLEKDRMRRLPDAADARLEIDDALNPLAGDADIEHPARLAGGAVASGWQRALPWASTAALAAGLAVVLMLWVPWRKPSPPTPVRVSAQLGADVSLAVAAGDAMSLSPDGSIIAFVAQQGAGTRPRLYVRRLTQLSAAPLSGTEDADSPFFSPDGQSIGFFAEGKLKKISVMGGAANFVCDAPNGRGGAWSEDGTILFLPNTAGSLMRVSSAGGTPEPLSALAEGETTHRWPQLLAGGKTVLFTSGGGGGGNDASLVVQALPSGTRTVVQRGGYHGRYLPSGHLVYLHDSTLFAVPFDLDRRMVTGPPVPVLEGVASNEFSGGAQFAVSASGTLVYLPGQATNNSMPIQWMDREGKTTLLRSDPASWANLLFAPDGRRLALQINAGPPDIWVYEWARESLTRLTSDPARDEKPVWTPDSRRIVYASVRGDKSTSNLYWQRADGTGDTQRLTESINNQLPASWHPSGKFLAFEEFHAAASSDLMILPMDGDELSGWKPGRPTVLLHSTFQAHEPMFSPDGRWLAYTSNEAGRSDVYVRPFPGPGGKSLISTGGGFLPTWSRTTHDLFYALNGQMMVVPYAVEGDAFRAEKPRLWSEGRFVTRGLNRMFDLHPDGERFAIAAEAPGGATRDHVTFVFNFFDELRRIAPVTKR